MKLLVTIFMSIISRYFSVSTFKIFLNKILKHLNSAGKDQASKMMSGSLTKLSAKKIIDPRYFSPDGFFKALLAFDATILAAQGISWIAEAASMSNVDEDGLRSALIEAGADASAVESIIKQFASYRSQSGIDEAPPRTAVLQENIVKINTMKDELTIFASLLGISKLQAIDLIVLFNKISRDVESYRLLA